MQSVHTDKLNGARVLPALKLPFGQLSDSINASGLIPAHFVSQKTNDDDRVGGLPLAGNLESLYSNLSKICRGQAFVVEPTPVRRVV